MSKKEDLFWQIVDMYEYAAFIQQDREAFLDMALEIKKLNKGSYIDTLFDLELANKGPPTEDQMSMLAVIFE